MVDKVGGISVPIVEILRAQLSFSAEEGLEWIVSAKLLEYVQSPKILKKRRGAVGFLG